LRQARHIGFGRPRFHDITRCLKPVSHCLARYGNSVYAGGIMAKHATLLALIALQSLPAWAEDDPYIIKTYASFAALKADTAKTCALITHDCELCTVSKNKAIACSSVGTACEPKEWRCYEKTSAPR
jgi:hypothetical protein